MENNLQSLEERHEEHEKDMQKQFEQTPEKPKPQPRQYPTKRTSYGKRKLDENAQLLKLKMLKTVPVMLLLKVTSLTLKVVN